MAATYKLQVISPERVVLDEEVISLIAPGTEGYLGVLANHAPLLASLAEGTLTVKKEIGSEQKYHLTGGFLEVANNKAVILADRLDDIA